MTKKNFTICVSLALAFVTAALAGDENSHWEKAYPRAEPGMVRHVVHLPTLADESTAKVELLVGKTVETDGVNQYFFDGRIQEETVAGWGYPRYKVSVGPMGSTLIGPAPGTPKVRKFVTLGAGPFLIRYNSKLPVVIYAPAGIEVRYRLWQAEPESKPVDKG